MSTKEKLREIINQFPYLPWALSLVWQASQGWTLAWGILLVIQGVLPVATVYLTRAIVDNLVIALSVENVISWQNFQGPLLYIGLMMIVLLLSESLRSITTWVRTAQAELVSDHIHDLIHRQAIQLDLSFYESKDYYDVLHRARIDAISKPVALLENMGSLVQNGITLFAMVGMLLAYSKWLPVALLVSTLPALGVVARTTLKFHRWRVHNTTNERRSRYLDWMLIDQHAAAEMRIFDLGNYFKTNYQNLRTKLRGERLKLLKEQMWLELLAGGTSLSFTALALGWMTWRVVMGAFSLGDLALFYQAFNQGQRVMRALLGNVGDIYNNLLFLENLSNFLQLETQISKAPSAQHQLSGIGQSIDVENVSFSYPGTERKALDRFSLHIPAGQITAIVGENGAGKSSLMKLLCRFYDPQEGEIRFDGIELRDISLDSLRRAITVLFQAPVQYQDTAANNIAFGDLSAQPSRAAIEAAAQAAGAEIPISKLPKDYETVVGRWFGDGELSQGEWQRVALARAFLRRASLIILDEPTSAMDSWAEADWLARFRDLVAGQTALIITHRFTTAMQADVIHVMDKGRVVESGTHTELMTLNGRYAASWLQQTRNVSGFASRND